MDALEFIREEIRMCASYEDCRVCPLDSSIYCSASPKKRSREEAEEIVKQVEAWSVEHPIKTRQSVFLEQWPEAILDRRGVSVLCPKQLNREFSCFEENDTEIPKRCKDCSACRHEFWMQEV